MTSTHDQSERESDPLLDSLLDEVVGGHGPPDLKDKILARWQAASVAANGQLEGDLLPPPIVITPQEPAIHRGGLRARRTLSTGSITAAACVLAALFTTWFIFHDADRPLASRDRVAGGHAPASSGSLARPEPTPVPRVPADDGPISGPADQPEDAVDPSETVPPAATDDPSSGPAASPDTAPPQFARWDDATVIAQLNQRLRDRWQQQQIVPAQTVSDEAWCRRVYQHLIGREPNTAELHDFLRGPVEDRQVALVDQLLGQTAYVGEFSARWAERWTEWLLRGSVTDSRAFRAGLQAYLTTTLSANQPYDQICAQLIAASGTNDPAAADFNGATNYLLALRDKSDPSDLTSQVCRAMIGQRLACAQCHDDGVHDRSQAEFWQLTATLNSVRTEVLRAGRRARLNDADPQRDLSLSFDTEGGASRAAPGGLDGQLLTVAAGASLRSQLADQIVASDSFARAAVNRLWSGFLRYGFTLPVDDLGRHNPVSHPELVDLLSEQFVAHDYDLRHLMRWIVLSDAFNRSDVIMTVNSKDAPTEGGLALFSRYYHRPVLFSSPHQGLAQLAAGNAPQATYSSDNAERQELMALRYGDPNGLESSSVPGSDRMGQLLPSHYLNVISRLANGKLSVDQQFDHAYQVVLNRRPNAEERAEAAAIFQAADGNAGTALERIFWVLLNSTP